MKYLPPLIPYNFGEYPVSLENIKPLNSLKAQKKAVKNEF